MQWQTLLATEVNVQSNGLGIAIYTGRVIGEGVVSSYVLFDLKNPGC